MGLFGKSDDDILSEGTQVTATVLAVDPTSSIRDGRERKAHLTLSYPGPVGAMVESKRTGWMPVDAPLHAGDRVYVRYDNDDPDHWVLDAGAHVVETTSAGVAGLDPAPAPAAPAAPVPGQVPDMGGMFAMLGDMGKLVQQAIEQGHMVQPGIVDARGVAGLREQMLAQLKAAGVEMQHINMAMPGAIPAAAGGEDTIARLEKLAALRERGILTEEEFQAQKKKILGEP